MNIIDGFTAVIRVLGREARRLHSSLRTGSLAFPSDGGRETGRHGCCCLVSKFASLARHGTAG